MSRGKVMKPNTSYTDNVMDRLTPLGEIGGRAMFGGYGIFHEGIMFGIISADTLYFKVNDSNRAAYESAGSQPFPHSHSYYEVPTDVLDDTTQLHDWARAALSVRDTTAKKKRR